MHLHQFQSNEFYIQTYAFTSITDIIMLLGGMVFVKTNRRNSYIWLPIHSLHGVELTVRGCQQNKIEVGGCTNLLDDPRHI